MTPDECADVLPGITVEKLLERAVRNAMPSIVGSAPRWVAVSDAFALGSTYSMALCRRYGLDPDEECARQVTCLSCEQDDD